MSHIETVKTGVCTDECCAPPVVSPTRPGQSGDRQALIREAFRLEWLTIGWMTANRLLLAAIAALALQAPRSRRRPIATSLVWASKGLAASHPFAGIKKRRATLRSFRSIGGGRRGHAMRSRRRPYRLLQENDEQSGVYRRGKEGNNRADGSQTMRMNAR